MAVDFQTARDAGIKIILRFAYTATLTASSPYGDATKARMLAHTAQLKATVRANADVIHVVQAGFIGTWGACTRLCRREFRAG